MRNYFFIFFNFICCLGYSQTYNSQIFNKWYQVRFVLIGSENDSYFSQHLFPVEFEINNENIKIYDPLDKNIFFTYDTKSNMFSDGIRLFNISGSSYKYFIDSITKNKLIISTPGAKIYYNRIISHDYKKGMIKLASDFDTITKIIKVLPEFNGKFSKFLVKNFKPFDDSCSRLISSSFIIHNTGQIDSVFIEEKDTAIKNEILRFLLATNGRWKINKKFKYYDENKISIKLIVMSKSTYALTKKSKNRNVSKQLYTEGCKYYSKEDYNRALYYFNESVLFSEYSKSLNNANLNSTNDQFINDDYNDAIMNRAATFYRLGQIDSACKDWEKILNNRPIIKKNIDEAKINIGKVCR